METLAHGAAQILFDSSLASLFVSGLAVGAGLAVAVFVVYILFNLLMG